MNVFSYKARTEKNESVVGRVEAQNIAEAGAVLRERGLFIISIVPYYESSFFASFKFSSVSLTDIVNFTRQLSTMVTAGLPLTDALGILSTQAKTTMKKIVDTLRRDIEGGAPLSGALEKHSPAFSPVYIALVKAGEAAGILDKILDRLADTLEKQKDFQGKTKGALIYPAMVLLTMAIVGVVMMVFVVPKLTAMYTDLGAQLPLPTRILMFISDFFIQFWYVLVLFVVGGGIGLGSYIRTPNGKLAFNKFLLRLPVLGPVFIKSSLVELTRTLSLLLSAGIPLISALSIVQAATGNAVFQAALEKVIRDVEKGQTLSAAVSWRTEFPLIMSQMMSVGEETGKMDEVLLKLSSYFEKESEQAVKGLTTAFEPLIIVILGIGVGFMIISVILPIYNLTEQF